MSTPDLGHRFAYHPPRDEATKSAHARVRAAAHEFAAVLDEVCPAGRELSTALTKVEEAMMWGNAGVARAVPPTPAVVACSGHPVVCRCPAGTHDTPGVVVRRVSGQSSTDASGRSDVLEHIQRHTPPNHTTREAA